MAFEPPTHYTLLLQVYNHLEIKGHLFQAMCEPTTLHGVWSQLRGTSVRGAPKTASPLDAKRVSATNRATTPGESPQLEDGPSKWILFPTKGWDLYGSTWFFKVTF